MEGTRVMHVLLACDHFFLLKGLCSLLKQNPKYEIVGTATDGFDVVDQAKNLRPDLIVMDLSLPLQNGIQSAKKIKDLLPQTIIILLSMYEQDNYIGQAFKAGVNGYVLKTNAFQEVKQALEVLEGGDFYLSPQISKGIQFLKPDRLLEGRDL